MIRLTVSNTHIDTREGVSQRTGNDYSISEQDAQLALPNGEIRNVKIGVDKGKPLAVGEYVPDGSAWFMDKFNEPKVSLRGKHWVLAKPVAAKAVA